uniref:cytochrome c oxidase subunit II n=1 Tax=Chrysopetalum debile TaxID=115833 RepID=UPI001EDFC457|nr:cytochrome c oxidase subunit II [Chrysopetalum debile]UJV31479.1 cytochrome c oxidase subunit 2 [Chrysopetalum debile]
MWSQLGLQDPASTNMLLLISFHDHAMMFLTFIITFVGYAMFALMLNSLSSRNTLEAQGIETVWTVAPIFILLFLASPSLFLLYTLDEITSPALNVKAIGHQWYWSYEYSDFLNLEFDSYMVPTNELQEGEFRLMEVDHRAVIPMQTQVRFLITAADVIHSWTVPSMGVKVDGIPGRLNQIMIMNSKPGVFYGQCSEICGANHSFMPIALEVVDRHSFINWINTYAE